jgi:cellulose synthase (UDP-forming)
MYLNSIFALRIGKVKKHGNELSAAASASPFVTVLLPTYNEAKVIDRILDAVASLDYKNFEVIVADDSTDKEMLDHLDAWKNKGIRVIQRASRKGFKAGALNNAIKQINPKCKYLLIFDADYLPSKNIIQQMLSDFTSKDIVAVQGYTKHTLNATENFWTKSVSVGFSAYSLVDIPARMHLNGFIPLFGSVMMISRTALSEVGGFDESSITEDYDLACKLTQRGYRIIFDESISVPAECPNGFRVLVKQQMRWAEGITRDTKNNLASMLFNKKVNLMKKLDFIYYGFSSLNGIIGTAAYALTLFVFLINQHIINSLSVDRTLILGLGLYGKFLLYVAPVYVSLGLIAMVVASLYREGRLSKSAWCINFYLVTLTLAPFIALSGIKGLFLKRGSWTRTKKTGEITHRS